MSGMAVICAFTSLFPVDAFMLESWRDEERAEHHTFLRAIKGDSVPRLLQRRAATPWREVRRVLRDPG